MANDILNISSAVSYKRTNFNALNSSKSTFRVFMLGNSLSPAITTFRVNTKTESAE